MTSAALEAIGKHFATVAALLAITWTVKKGVVKFKPRERKPSIPKTRSYRLLVSPSTEFDPDTPEWLTKAAELANEGLPVGLHPPEPPSIQQLLAMDFGRKSVRELFLLKENVHYLNHGSYGAAFRAAAEAQSWFLRLLEEQPCHFQISVAPAALQASKDAVAEYIGVDAADVVALPNATSAINTVLFSTVLQPGDLLLMTSITYGAVKNTLARFASRSKAGLVEVALPLDTLLAGPAAILERFQSVLAIWGRRIRLLVLDHITSTPTVHMPVAQIAAICRQAGVQVLMDGAHAVGAVPLDVPALGVQYYTSNLHKWACTPKGAAFLWVERSCQAAVMPLVTSYGYARGFQAEFAWQGTSDISAWLAVRTSLQIQQRLGTKRVRDHNHRMLLRAVDLLQRAWIPGLAVLGADSPSSHMASLELPPMPGFPPSAASAGRLHNHLLQNHAVEVPTTFWEGRLWARISAQIYNTVENYEALAEAIEALAKRTSVANGIR